ncbi:aldehyde dehydrogenase [Ureibacillus massiliensis 4400831 = CIP 108448 = CCUG 49529]|uniref:Aldehyde dehydrogenase n=1 Tax=Ureibacillus massiliensis 4400831 = CIP 108448 = CCUG 49529 TaxID=1211035 RepID=A0A0A3J2D8_9BACL|nr:alpha-ketoglutaric semialdehyde dehydrogenase GucD [Ureibacillus massiliensis]KGR91121.1 aldehyde dehydrogenase [Ureibacillus massiliensis 4400831 = CIP 108448 = CCUG 49529]
MNEVFSITEEVHSNFINGEWKQSTSGKLIDSINPANRQVMGQVQSSTIEEANEAIEAAHNASKEWAKVGEFQRGQYLYKVAALLEENLEEIAKTLTEEMGKTYPEALGETQRGIAILKYYAAEGSRSNGDVIPASEKDALMFTKRIPLGVVGVITPWNFPVAIPIWKIAPALVYGNTVVFKPASEAAVTAAKVAKCFADAGLPSGVFNFITGSGSTVGDAIINSKYLKAITFTGSSKTGKMIAEIASKNQVKYQLEMGGKNPVIVLDDANLENAVQAVVSGAFKSTGQKCTATSRVIIQSGIYEQFRDRLVEVTKGISVGSGLDSTTWMGPCASEGQYKTVLEYIEIAKNEGATLITGGHAIDSELTPGFYVEPTIFDNVTTDMRIAQEEVFGPVIALIKAESIEDAISFANDAEYGLSASIFTTNIGNALAFIDDIEAGLVRVNAESAGVEYQAPFGGLKDSSSGSREQGQAAKEFFTVSKTVYIKAQ